MPLYTFNLNDPERDTRTELSLEQEKIVQSTLNPETDFEACYQPMKWGMAGATATIAGGSLSAFFNGPEPVTTGLLMTGFLSATGGCMGSFFKGLETALGPAGTVALNSSGSNHKKTHLAASQDRAANKLEIDGGDPKEASNLRQSAHDIRQSRNPNHYPHLDLDNEVLPTDPIELKHSNPLWELSTS